MPSKPAIDRTIRLEAEPADAGQRLDKWLAGKLPGISRSRVQALIRDGHVRSGATIGEARQVVKPGAAYDVDIPEPDEAPVTGEALPLSILYEDDDVIVIDKPAGVVVHPAAGHDSGTLVNALIAHCGDSLSGIGGVKRPGIVHRLDKDTSGVLVVAKSDAAHQGLADQFRSHGRDGRLERSYLALVWGVPQPRVGRISAPLMRSTANRKKITVAKGNWGREAVTHYEVVETFPGEDGSVPVSLVRLTLETGRTHQIRVHLAHIGHPVLGDPVYGAGFKTRVAKLSEAARQALEGLGRQALHAARLGFEHPVTGEPLEFESQPPDDIEKIINVLKRAPGKKARR